MTSTLRVVVGTNCAKIGFTGFRDDTHMTPNLRVVVREWGAKNEMISNV